MSFGFRTNDIVEVCASSFGLPSQLKLSFRHPQFSFNAYILAFSELSSLSHSPASMENTVTKIGQVLLGPKPPRKFVSISQSSQKTPSYI